MKIVIFGSTGLLGSELTLELTRVGHKVWGIGREEANNGFSIDISEESSFKLLNFNADILIHAASLLPQPNESLESVHYWKNLFETNLIGTINILNWAKNHSVKKWINCSSLSIYAKPWPDSLSDNEIANPSGIHLPYSSSKYLQELFLKEVLPKYKIEFLNLRFSALYSSKVKTTGILHTLIQKAINDENITLFDGNKVYLNFLNVKNVVHLINLAIELKRWPNIDINVGDKEEISLLELAKKIVQLSDSKSEISNEDKAINISKASLAMENINYYFKDFLTNQICLENGLQDLIDVYKQAIK